MMPLAKTHNSHSFKPTTNHSLSRLKENMILVMNHLTNVGNWTKVAQALVDKLFGSRTPHQVPLVEYKPHEHIDGGADGNEVVLGFISVC